MAINSLVQQPDPYMALFDYGGSSNPGSGFGSIQYYQPGSTSWPGMTPDSPSFGQPMGSPGSMTYTPPELAVDKRGWGELGALGKMSAIGSGVQAFATLAQLYTGFKSLQQQKDQFKFTKSAWNKNFSASLAAYDNSLRDHFRKTSQGAAYFGNSVPSEQEWMASRSLGHLA